MNRQRKIVITITYNEMGIIIDTKAEELDLSAQPERKMGKWIPVTKIYKVTEDQFPKTHIEWVDATELDEIDAVRCSECGEVFDFQDARNWCTECGADMRASVKDIPLNTDDIFDAELAKRILNNK